MRYIQREPTRVDILYTSLRTHTQTFAFKQDAEKFVSEALQRDDVYEVQMNGEKV